ncbi:uncharacterized protein DUF4239 [Roseiarcus fermentans]|uniref:Uncharacterized protein DUF4239 n=1 Tax=Roseiarcus fermentans TaxID=1473586 RepID=A0A366EZS4_9HYPH|nr:DUF4239 domain-containing protein [Roseiarcus fermentans]RBP07386.1 uncharacterized protein DUF4239 [Roseiarcus fermentans]
MDGWKLGLAVAAAIFVSGLVGLVLQRVLPERLTTGPAADMIGAVAGLLSLLSALVLGLLVWTAYGVYSGQNVAIETLAAKVLQLDLALIDYGRGADAGRALLRQDLARTIDEIWGAGLSDRQFAANSFSAALANLKRRQAYLDSLTPATDGERAALAAAQQTVESIAQARLSMAFALSNPVPYPLVFAVMAWAATLFLGFGLKSRLAGSSLVALGVGAFAVGSVAALIVDLSAPYSGAFRVSPVPLQQVLGYVGQGQGAVGVSR